MITLVIASNSIAAEYCQPKNSKERSTMREMIIRDIFPSCAALAKFSADLPGILAFERMVDTAQNRLTGKWKGQSFLLVFDTSKGVWVHSTQKGRTYSADKVRLIASGSIGHTDINWTGPKADYQREVYRQIELLEERRAAAEAARLQAIEDARLAIIEAARIAAEQEAARLAAAEAARIEAARIEAARIAAEMEAARIAAEQAAALKLARFNEINRLEAVAQSWSDKHYAQIAACKYCDPNSGSHHLNKFFQVMKDRNVLVLSYNADYGQTFRVWTIL